MIPGIKFQVEYDDEKTLIAGKPTLLQGTERDEMVRSLTTLFGLMVCWNFPPDMGQSSQMIVKSVRVCPRLCSWLSQPARSPIPVAFQPSLS